MGMRIKIWYGAGMGELAPAPIMFIPLLIYKPNTIDRNLSF